MKIEYALKLVEVTSELTLDEAASIASESCDNANCKYNNISIKPSKDKDGKYNGFYEVVKVGTSRGYLNPKTDTKPSEILDYNLSLLKEDFKFVV